MTNGLRYLGHEIAFYPLYAGRDLLTHKQYNYKEDILKVLTEKLKILWWIY